MLTLKNTSSSPVGSLDGIQICDLTQSAANLAGESEASVFHPSEQNWVKQTQTIVAAVDDRIDRSALCLMDFLK